MVNLFVKDISKWVVEKVKGKLCIIIMFFITRAYSIGVMGYYRQQGYYPFVVGTIIMYYIDALIHINASYYCSYVVKMLMQ